METVTRRRPPVHTRYVEFVIEGLIRLSGISSIVFILAIFVFIGVVLGSLIGGIVRVMQGA